ncbi:MAG TPA: hypothetical protein VHW92_08560 [Mycobacteriales bacterium]|jgi:hypothetical protein|nr:hypothetical protein [Mycobacteriales bacterium]
MTSSPIMDRLAAGVPVTLLCDLADPGLDSVAINAVERPADDQLWIEAAQAVVARSAGAA